MYELTKMRSNDDLFYVYGDCLKELKKMLPCVDAIKEPGDDVYINR